MNKKLLLTIYLLLFSCSLIYAQSPSWQWGIRGGSAETYGGSTDETVVDMVTDQHGNVYVLSVVLQTALNVDGVSVTGYGGQDMLISSFKCDGTFRWAKDIGGNNEDLPTAIKTDTLGGVYVVGYMFLNSSTGHFSTDTTVPVTNQTLVLFKYDTAGNYKWLRFPQSAGVGTGTLGQNAAYDMDVDGGGNSYILAQLTPDTYGGTYMVTTKGQYILHYDKNGNFISGNQMQIATTGTSAALRMKKDFKNSRYYVTGNLESGTLSFDGVPITQALFLGCFNNAGNLLWQKQNTSTYTVSGFARAAVDASDNIYLTGTSFDYMGSDTFDSYIVINIVPPYIGQVPLIVKIDKNGNLIWGKNGSDNNAGTQSAAVTVNGNEVDIAGQYPGELRWAGYPDSLNLASGSEFHIFITRFNAATDSVLGLDSLASTFGLSCDATAMTSDKFGNFYVGGDFPSQITVDGTTLTSIGGNSDFFVAKYGTASCVCVLPTASFTHSGTHTVSFTYTGSTTYDSVRWNFGDGGTSTTLSPTHTYTASGTYTACIIVYGTCGNDTACQTITATGTTGVASAASGLSNISIYPNPATEELNITGVTANTAYRIYNMTGTVMQQGKLNTGTNSVSLRGYAPGMYILDITGADGSRIITRVVKQ